jgi:hydroxyacylglutathione hydrolase
MSGSGKLNIEPLPAFSDNYIWVLRKPDCNRVAVVDPGDAAVVSNYLRGQQLFLDTILITHRHSDHTGGISALLENYPGATVYGPAAENIPGIKLRLSEGETIEIESLGCCLQVMDVPGHTAGHIAYYLPDDKSPAVFCGDTLFSVGCGRLFDGTAAQLYQSLQKLAGLPAKTGIYCAHEYTLRNIEFALQVMPGNKDLLARASQVKQLRARGVPSVPVTIEQERLSNPFLRVSTAEVRQAVEKHFGKRMEDPLQVFTQLRKWKDVF